MKIKNQAGFSHILVFILIAAVLGCVGFAGWQAYRSNQIANGKMGSGGGAKQAKAWLSDCDKSQTANFTHAPMDVKDVSTIIPTGALAGAHVTPIDHLYFYPKDMQHRDAAAVYAMADGYIVNYEERGVRVDTGQKQQPEYQLYFQNSCSVLSYFDLMTSLEPEIASAIKANHGNLHIPVKAGQKIGRVGAQSLDTAIYNFDKTLPGFINPASYSDEPVKLHTDDFFSYFKGTVRSDMLALNPRKVEPFGGKIDYDIDGKLRGNWFLEGSNGYAGVGNKHYADNNGQGYWSGHLAIVPNVVDPSIINLSFGDYQGKATQFSAVSSTPDPATVDMSSGVVKYELGNFQQAGPGTSGSNTVGATSTATATGNGQPATSTATATSTSGQSQSRVQGVVLFQLTDKRKLKMETFPGKTAAQVTGFTSNAKTYVR